MKFLKQLFPLFMILALFAVSSCQHDTDLYVPDNNNIGQILNPDPVQASVTGKVINENDAPVAGAVVRSGTHTTVTDNRGLFRFSNIEMDKFASVVSVELNGYFKGIRTFAATAASANFIKIKLIPKALAGTVNASGGGTVALSNNSIVTLAANSVVVKSTGQAYTGTINVFAANIDPTANDIPETVPGSFQATDTGNFRVLLKSYGMLAVQLESPSGQLLQIASGKTARLHFTIPASLSASAPATIPLWSLNETDGLWKEEGQATKNGGAYDGDVAHFSFWNCDVSSNTVYLELTANTADGPLPNAVVKITRANDGGFSYGYTDSAGHVGGIVFSNEQLLLEVLNNCYETIYTQNIGPYTQNTNLGTITVTVPAQYTLTITGNAVDCNTMPVTNGNAMIYWEGQLITTPINNGSFSATITSCSSGAATIEVTAANNDSQQQSLVWTGSASTGIVNTGTLFACGNSSLQFINYSINGTDYSYSSPADDLGQYSIQGGAASLFTGSNPTGTLNIGMAYPGTAVGSSQQLLYFNSTHIDSSANGNYIFSPPVFVNITESGNIGEFISGNFEGDMITNLPVNTYHLRCTFRIRREF